MNIPKRVYWIPALFFAQQLPAVAAWGVDLPLIFVVLMSLRTTPSRAAAWGALMGILQDLLSAGWVGPECIAKTFVGILCSFSQRHIFRERVLTQTVLIFFATLVHQFMVWLLLKWDGSAPSGGDAVWIGVRSAIMTTIVGFIVCTFVVRFRRRRNDPATA